MTDENHKALAEGLVGVIETYQTIGVSTQEIDDAWQSAMLQTCPDFERLPDDVLRRYLDKKISKSITEATEKSMVDAAVKGFLHGEFAALERDPDAPLQ